MRSRTAADIGTLDLALQLAVKNFGHVVLLDIGVHDGDNAQAMVAVIEAAGGTVQYHGVDNLRDHGLTTCPIPGGRLYLGDSAELMDSILAEPNFVSIDGCHCINHAILDFLHYGSSVPVHGLVTFHDTDPQLHRNDYQGHGPRIPRFCTAGVGMALERLDLPNRDWRLVLENGADGGWGGTRVFQRQ